MGLVQSHQTWTVTSCSILQQCKSQVQLMQRLNFVEYRNVDKLQLGLQKIGIFRLKQAPYQSLMICSRTFQYWQQSLLMLFQTLKRLSEVIVHRNLAPIHFIKVSQQHTLFVRTIKIEYYSTYYGIELRDIIESRKCQDYCFSQGQVLYVLKSLINFSLYLQKNNIYFGQYQSKNIFLSDNGYLKLYLLHVFPPYQSHARYYNPFNYGGFSNVMSFLPIAPEVINQINQCCLTPDFDIYKAQVFQIGMIVLDMIVENSLNRYYRKTKHNVMFDCVKVKKDLDQLRQNGLYAQKVINFIENILEVNPINRFNLQQADQYLEQLKKQVNFTCKINIGNQTPQDEGQTIKKVSFKSQQPQSHKVLRSIQKSLESKLNPVPLKSLSKFSAVNRKYQKQTSINKCMYTKRRSTGVSIISSFLNKNQMSTSDKNEKDQKFATVKNSRVVQHIFEAQKVNKINQVANFQCKTYCSEKYRNSQHGPRQKLSQNWLNLENTRITQQNIKTSNILPPKGRKSAKSNPKLQIHHRSKQNQKDIIKKNGLISTHIRTHINKIMNPINQTQNKSDQLPTFTKIETQRQLTVNKSEQPVLEKHKKTICSNMQINQYFRA